MLMQRLLRNSCINIGVTVSISWDGLRMSKGREIVSSANKEGAQCPFFV